MNQVIFKQNLKSGLKVISLIYPILFMILSSCSNPLGGDQSKVNPGTAIPTPLPQPTFNWNAGAWNACNVTCGGGVQTRTVICQQDNGDVANFLQCSLPGPSDTQACNTQVCPVYTWRTSGFNSCSQTCGGGTQSQTVTCEDQFGASQPDSFCDPATRPVASQSCNTQSCPVYSWTESGFGSCSQTCGGGTQTQSVTCHDQFGSLALDASCDPSTRPLDSQSCNPQACPIYSWESGGFGSCSQTCGGGTQTQSVTCKDQFNALALDSACDPATKPAQSQTCNSQACDVFSWNTGLYGSCSQSCGGGTQSRSVTCENQSNSVFADSYCSATPKPASNQSCNPQACATPIVASPVAASFDEDTDSGRIDLNYNSSVSTPAVSCSVSSLNHVQVTQSCSCTAGVCSVHVQGSQDYHGAASFSFELVDQAGNTSSQSASLTIASIDDAPLGAQASSYSAIPQCPANNVSTLKIPIVYSDVDGDSATSCQVLSQSSAFSGTASCSCTLGACSVSGLRVTDLNLQSLTPGQNQTISAGLTYTVTANSKTSASSSLDLVVNHGTWTPTCLGPNLRFWYDASDITTVRTGASGAFQAVAGDPISIWTDKSGNGYHATAVITDRQPTYSLSAGPYGSPAVVFNGVNNGLVATGITWQEYTIASVIRHDDISSVRALLTKRMGTNNFFWFLYSTSTPANSHTWDQVGSATRAGTGFKPGTSTSYIYELHRPTSTRPREFWVNGALEKSIVQNPDEVNGYDMIIGNDYSAPGRGAWARYSEMVGSVSALSTGNRQKIEGYLGWKWNTAADLPSGHAYRLNAP